MIIIINIRKLFKVFSRDQRKVGNASGFSPMAKETVENRCLADNVVYTEILIKLRELLF